MILNVDFLWSQTEIIDSYNEMNRLGYNNCSKQLELIFFLIQR